mmetsp:Transcript_9524/g.30458  ORF Transcript_9524/g.30458 Transcript_9524/m.30458 type:complete len:207 (+) Transcript_9524:1261-1881(+)
MWPSPGAHAVSVMRAARSRHPPPLVERRGLRERETFRPPAAAAAAAAAASSSLSGRVSSTSPASACWLLRSIQVTHGGCVSSYVGRTHKYIYRTSGVSARESRGVRSLVGSLVRCSFIVHSKGPPSLHSRRQASTATLDEKETQRGKGERRLALRRRRRRRWDRGESRGGKSVCPGARKRVRGSCERGRRGGASGAHPRKRERGEK